ncbi:MAG: hypothetical protein ACFCVC_14005 [Acidimicrobiia bacterium]
MRTLIIALIAFIATSMALPAAAAEISIAELDAEAPNWSGLEVTIEGEIIGDYSIRGDEVWVQVNDDAYVEDPLLETGRLAGGNVGMGVRMPSEVFSTEWGAPGGYQTRGPVVRVTGTFRYLDPDTGGDTFVDAASVVLVEPARRLEPPPAEMDLLAAAVAMIALGAGMWARARWRLLNPKQ